jgi:hypothetical protein
MSSALTPCNARALTVSRASNSSFDRYGNPNNVTAFSLVTCRLTLKDKVKIDKDGEAVAINGQLWFPPDKRLIPGDVVKIDTAGDPEYKVISVNESRDVLGVLTGVNYDVVRKR